LESVALLAVEVVGLASFAYVFTLFMRVYLKLRDGDSFSAAFAYGMLAAAQLFAVLSIVVDDLRLASAFYTATSSFALAGFAAMLLTIRGERIYIHTAVIALMVSPDIASGILAAILSAFSVGTVTQISAALLSSSYIFRGLSLLLATRLASPIIFFVAEALRAVAALMLSTYHALRAAKV